MTPEKSIAARATRGHATAGRLGRVLKMSLGHVLRRYGRSCMWLRGAVVIALRAVSSNENYKSGRNFGVFGSGKEEGTQEDSDMGHVR